MSLSPPTPSFRELLGQFRSGHNPHEVFKAFVRLAACALSAGTREADYLAEAKKWDRSQLDLFGRALGALVVEMEAQPFADLLGPVYMDTLGAKSQQWNAEFHTPGPICQMMARLVQGGAPLPPGDEKINLMEPACGSGAMILAYAEAMPPEAIRRLRVTAIDVSLAACDMCFINTTLWGIPATIIHGNTLSGEYWAQWKNLHRAMPYLGRLMAMRSEMPSTAERDVSFSPVEFAELKASQGQPPTATAAAAITADLGQLDFTFGDSPEGKEEA